MPSPFPGMDPYLEHPENWRDVHHWLITAVVDQLRPQLVPRGYVATIESRTFLEFSERAVEPDVSVRNDPRHPVPPGMQAIVLEADPPVRLKIVQDEVHEDYVLIREIGGRKGIVSGLEVISPSNKRAGDSRAQYLRKRRELRRDGVSLVEIDLLRAGKSLVRLPLRVVERRSRDEYVVNIVRAGSTDFEYYPIKLRDRLPRVAVPLKPGEPDAAIDLQEAVRRAYAGGSYDIRVDYSASPQPRLTTENADWADALLIEKGRRPHRN